MDAWDKKHADARQGQTNAVHDFGTETFGEGYQRKSPEKGHEVVKTTHLSVDQSRLPETRGGIVGRVEKSGGNGQHDVLPVTKHGVPLKQFDQRKLLHRQGHIAYCLADLPESMRPARGLPADAVQFILRQRNFPGGAHRPEDRSDGKDGPDDKGRHGDIGDVFGVDRVLIHPDQYEQGGRQVRQRLAEPGKSTLGQEADGMLGGVQFVAHECAIGLHRDVVGCIENPEQAGGHPKRAAERHKEQADAAQYGADEEIGRPAPVPADGFIAHRPDDGLYDQARHGARQPEVRQAGFVGAQVFVDRAHVALLQPEAVLDAEKTEVHVDNLPKTQAWFCVCHVRKNILRQT